MNSGHWTPSLPPFYKQGMEVWSSVTQGHSTSQRHALPLHTSSLSKVSQDPTGDPPHPHATPPREFPRPREDGSSVPARTGCCTPKALGWLRRKKALTGWGTCRATPAPLLLSSDLPRLVPPTGLGKRYFGSWRGAEGPVPGGHSGMGAGDSFMVLPWVEGCRQGRATTKPKEDLQPCRQAGPAPGKGSGQ